MQSNYLMNINTSYSLSLHLLATNPMRHIVGNIPFYAIPTSNVISYLSMSLPYLGGWNVEGTMPHTESTVFTPPL